ncbi:hypothetical protein SRHO_G00312650 [Serrasalmus rhombeus]
MEAKTVDGLALRQRSSITGPGEFSGKAVEVMLRPLCNSPPCGCWGGCLPKIPFFCFEDKTLERQIEEDFLRHLQRESRETERELEEMKREVRRLKKNQCKLEEKGRRQQEKERKKEERERAQRKKSMERMRLSQIERWTLCSSPGQELDSKACFPSIPRMWWTLHIEDIHLMITSDAQKPTDSTKDPTPENNVEEQEINDPEEPSPQPQAFSEPQEDTQIFTDSSKLLTKEEDEAEVGASSQADDIKESVLQTPQKGSMVQCCVQRDRTDKSGPTYRMFQELEDGKKQLLLVARRMKKNNTSSYVITDGESDEDHNVVGRLSFNRQRTQFTLSDSGRNPTKSSGALQEESSTQELLALSYESLFGFMKSQQMTAVIPSPDRNSQRVSFVEGSLLKQLKRKNQGPNLIKLNTKEPVWSSKQKAHVLDFNGRVKKASLKNFQLACPANPDEKVIQFGRVDEDHFALDYSFPLCALQALAIALSCFE